MNDFLMIYLPSTDTVQR